MAAGGCSALCMPAGMPASHMHGASSPEAMDTKVATTLTAPMITVLSRAALWPEPREAKMTGTSAGQGGWQGARVSEQWVGSGALCGMAAGCGARQRSAALASALSITSKQQGNPVTHRT